MNKWGIIGYGRIARRFIDNLKQTDGILYAIASKSAKDAPCEILYHDYESLLNDTNVDLIYIALPHKFHYDVIVEAIKHHKAVLCEKPMVLTVEQMKNIQELARKEKVLVMEALKSRMIPLYQQLKEDIQTIDLESIDCGFCYYTPYQPNSYLFDKEQGGALNDVGSYSIGFVLDMVNAPIEKMNSTLNIENGIDTHFNTQILFSNGVKAHIEGALDEKKDSIGYIKGKKGSIEVPYFYRPSSYQIHYHDGRTVERTADPNHDMRYEIMEMMQLLKEGKTESEVMSLDHSLQIAMVVEEIKKDGM